MNPTVSSSHVVTPNNAIQREVMVDGDSNVTALFEEFGKAGYSYDLLHDSQGRITNLFLAHPISVKLARAFPYTFVMDSTYKTNIYNMPLLDVIGISCFNTFFYAGFGFLERDDEKNYTWALNAFKKIAGHGDRPVVIVTTWELALMNAIKNVYPTTTNLLCVRNVGKNVSENCKKYFGCAKQFGKFKLSWKNVVNSTTEAQFVRNWEELLSFCSDKKEAIEYINNTWLPWKQNFVCAWTDKSLHFGISSSSARAKGAYAHAKLKEYLQISTGGGFQEVKDYLHGTMILIFTEIKAKLGSQSISVLSICRMSLFKQLLYRVSHFALKEIYEQYKKSEEGTMAPCTGHFMATMGLPCSHKIKEWHGRALPVELIHPNWRIDSASLSLKTDSDTPNDVNAKFDKLLNELQPKFQLWSLNKKEFATMVITKLINQSDLLCEQVIQRPQGSLPKSNKKRAISPTRRDPSRFEHVESSQTHYSSTSTCVGRNSGGTVDEYDYIFHDNNSLDLNLYPDFSSDYMLFE
uniref:uncharacterized protein LOC122595302 n=1 Tax=Erigeron canadensis TaxID=72917 RepID=UPI001CB94CB2|nr:uncharacterized protein LOC122595302 [Erigeron canadensis]